MCRGSGRRLPQASTRANQALNPDRPASYDLDMAGHCSTKRGLSSVLPRAPASCSMPAPDSRQTSVSSEPNPSGITKHAGRAEVHALWCPRGCRYGRRYASRSCRGHRSGTERRRHDAGQECRASPFDVRPRRLAPAVLGVMLVDGVRTRRFEALSTGVPRRCRRGVGRWRRSGPPPVGHRACRSPVARHELADQGRPDRPARHAVGIPGIERFTRGSEFCSPRWWRPHRRSSRCRLARR